MGSRLKEYFEDFLNFKGDKETELRCLGRKVMWSERRREVDEERKSIVLSTVGREMNREITERC